MAQVLGVSANLSLDTAQDESVTTAITSADKTANTKRFEGVL